MVKKKPVIMTAQIQALQWKKMKDPPKKSQQLRRLAKWMYLYLRSVQNKSMISATDPTFYELTGIININIFII